MHDSGAKFGEELCIDSSVAMHDMVAMAESHQNLAKPSTVLVKVAKSPT